MTKLMNVKGYVLFAMFICILKIGYSEGLPPGWEYIPTPVTHIVAIKLSVIPNINGFPLNPGDYIGAFYIDDNNTYKCGGAVEWFGDQNTGIIIYGDDSFTPQKDGFDSGELINWKVFSWSVQKAYDAEVTCDPELPSSCTSFVGQGLAGLASFDASGYFLIISANPENICQGDLVQLAANPSGGSGNYSYSWSSVPSGFFSNLANPQVYPVITTQYVVQVSDGSESITLSLFVEVTSPPYVSSGSDQTICEDQFVYLNGIMTNGTNPVWSTNGDGIFLDPTLLTTQYFPGPNDLLGGTILLDLSAQPISPCSFTVYDQLNIIIQFLPEVDAGIDQVVCENEEVILLPNISYFESIIWETNGDGFFQNPNIPETTYTPGAEDKLAGLVTLTIFLNPLTPCIGQVNDFLLVEIELLPSANAGEDIVICQNNFAELSATANNFLTIQWSTSGDGSFDNPGSLDSDYFPGMNDIINDGVVLTISSLPLLPCVLISSDELNLSIIRLPVTSAGMDATICHGMIHQVTASASNYDELLWVTSGDGTFEDESALITYYYPGAFDLVTGYVQLTIFALPQYPCMQQSLDDLQVTFQPLPSVEAGDDATIHSDETFQLSGFATEFGSLLWNTSGDGTFSNQEILDPLYSPGANDIFAGSVQLTLTAFPISPCSISSFDSLLLTIDSFTFISNYDQRVKSFVYPNPSVDFFNITAPGNFGKDFQIRVFDNFGKNVISLNPALNDFSERDILTIDTRSLLGGCYYVEIIGKTNTIIHKILIQH